MAWPPPPGDQHDPHQRLASDEEDAADELNWMAAMATTFAMGSKKNGSHDYSSAVLKPFVSSIYPVFVLQYGLLVLFGFSVNSAVIFFILRRRLFREITHSFVLNLCLSHCVQCLVVMPITLTVLLLQNWVLGQFFCYFLAMLQVKGRGRRRDIDEVEEEENNLFKCPFPSQSQSPSDPQNFLCFCSAREKTSIKDRRGAIFVCGWVAVRR